MTDLSSLPFHGGEAPATRNGAVGRKRCTRHRWEWTEWQEDQSRVLSMVQWCSRCHLLRDTTASRRGRSSSRLGKDQERRIERVYGPWKRGQYGDAVDHVGRDWKWQAKATRGQIPKWLAEMGEHTKLPRSITDPLGRMDPLFAELRPLVIRSYIRAGVRTADYIFVRWVDWWRLHGPMVGFREARVVEPAEAESGDTYVVMTGTVFLELNGRDEPR